MPWWEYYGFISNPLDIRPNKKLFGIENIEDKIIRSIENGEIFLLYGPIGSGKTSLAYRIIDYLSEYYNFIYLNGEANKNINLIDIVNDNLYKRFLFLKIRNKKKIVLILDEFYNFDIEISKQLKYLYDNNIIKSAFLIQINPELTNIIPSLANRIFNKYEMPLLDVDTIIKIIKYRLKNKIRFNENYLRYIIIKNDRNIRSIFIELNNLLENMKHPVKDIINPEINIENLNNKQKIDSNHIKISPQQLEILKVLFGNKLTIKKLSELTNIKVSSLTKQLSRLSNKGLIIKEEKDNNVYYYINPKYISEISKLLGK